MLLIFRDSYRKYWTRGIAYNLCSRTSKEEPVYACPSMGADDDHVYFIFIGKLHYLMMRNTGNDLTLNIFHAAERFNSKIIQFLFRALLDLLIQLIH